MQTKCPNNTVEESTLHTFAVPVLEKGLAESITILVLGKITLWFVRISLNQPQSSWGVLFLVEHLHMGRRALALKFSVCRFLALMLFFHAATGTE